MVMIIQMMTTISGMIGNYGNDHPDDDKDDEWQGNYSCKFLILANIKHG